MLSEKDLKLCDQWILENGPDLAKYSFEDIDEYEDEVQYRFIRHSDGAMVTYHLRVKDGEVDVSITEINP